MHIPPELLPVIQITLPVIVTMVLTVFLAVSSQNKRVDDVVAELREIRGELRDIRKELANQGERLAHLEERIPPLIHR